MGGWGKPEYNCGLCRRDELHVTRNCSKYFPDAPRLTDEQAEMWIADYGTPANPALIEDVRTLECPASAITDESRQLVELVNRNRHVQSNVRSSIFGIDASEFPAKLNDVLELVAIEQIRVSNALHEASMVKEGGSDEQEP